MEVIGAGPSGGVDVVLVAVMVTDVDLGTPYDRDNNELIDQDEAVEAISDHFAERITRDELLAVIRLYFADGST